MKRIAFFLLLLLLFIVGCQQEPCVCECQYLDGFTSEPEAPAATAKAVEAIPVEQEPVEPVEAEPVEAEPVEAEPEEEPEESEAEPVAVETSTSSDDTSIILTSVKFDLDDDSTEFGHITLIDLEISAGKDDIAPIVKVFSYAPTDDIDIKSLVEEEFAISTIDAGESRQIRQNVQITVGELEKDRIIKLKAYDSVSGTLLASAEKVFNFQ